MQYPRALGNVFYLPRSLRKNLSEAWLEIEELWKNFPCKNPKLRADRSKAGTIRLLQRCVVIKKSPARRTQNFNNTFARQVFGGTKNIYPMMKAVTQVLADHGVIDMKRKGQFTHVSIAGDEPLIATVARKLSADTANEIKRRKAVQAKQIQTRDYDAWIRVDNDVAYADDAPRIDRCLANRTDANLSAMEERGLIWRMNTRVIRGNNRYHSFWTSLSKPARACAYDIRTGLRVVGIDAVNAQPSLIGHWIAEYARFRWSQAWYGGPERDIINNKLWKSEFDDFRKSCYAGIYDTLAESSDIDREQVKSHLLWLMFRNPKYIPKDPVRSAILSAFSRRWPLVNSVIELNNGRMARRYKTGDCLSWHGRSLESKMMNEVVSSLKRLWATDNSLGWFVVHDCLFVTRQHRVEAFSLVRKVGNKYGVRFSMNP